MQPLGSYLKSEREKRGIQLEEIASSTKIHIQNLILMEEDRWKELPQEPFIRGFISAYARYVGLDNKETLKLFSQYQGSQAVAQQNLEAGSSSPKTDISKSVDSSSPTDKRENPSQGLNSNPLKLALIAAGIVIIITLVAVNFASSRKTPATTPVVQTQNETTSTLSEIPTTTLTDTTTTSTLPETSTSLSSSSSSTLPSTSSLSPTTTIPVDSLQSVPQAPPSQASAPIAIAPPVEPAKPEGVKPETAPISGHEIVVESKNRSWMKIVIDNEPPKESYLEPNIKMTFQAKEKIKLVLGNTTAVSVLYNGQEVKGNKFAGTVRYYIFPKGSKFPQERPKSNSTEEKSEDGSEIPTNSEEPSQPPSE